MAAEIDEPGGSVGILRDTTDTCFQLVAGIAFLSAYESMVTRY